MAGLVCWQRVPCLPRTLVGDLVGAMAWVLAEEAGVCLAAASDHASKPKNILSLFGGLWRIAYHLPTMSFQLKLSALCRYYFDCDLCRSPYSVFYVFPLNDVIPVLIVR